MSVAAKYLNRELMGVFSVTLLTLLLVAVGGRFIGYLQEAAMGKFSGATVLTIIGLRLPEFVQLVAPFAVYVSILITLGRWYADREMVVLQSAGVGTRVLLQWVSITLGVVVAVIALLTCWITPMAQQALADFMAQERAQTEFEAVNPGKFHIYDRARRVTYSRAMSDDRKVLYDVFMSQRLEDGRRINIWAEQGTQEVDPESQEHYLVLTNGQRYELPVEGMGMRKTEFAQLRQRLELFDRSTGQSAVEALPMTELGDDPKAQAEWHWRLALPLFALIGGLLAVGISSVEPRQGRFAKVVPGLLMMLIYYLALLVNQNAIAEGQVPTILGLWPVHATFAGIAMYCLYRLGLPARTR
jgi:lipopolysaccharide export system permease protein